MDWIERVGWPFVEGIGVIVTLLLLTYQLWMANRVTKATNYTSALALSITLNELIFENEDLMEFYGGSGEEKKFRQDAHFIIGFRHLQHLYLQRRRRLISQPQWESHLQGVDRLINPRTRERWETMRITFEPGFRTLIDQKFAPPSGREGEAGTV